MIMINFLFAITFLLFSYYLINPAEDAVILYEYSKTFAETGIISYGNNGIPIEGATDFLWMMIISLFSFFGINEFLASLILSALALFLILQTLKSLKYNALVCIACILMTPYIYAASQGFSPLFFSAFYVLCLLFFNKKHYSKMYLCILLLCLVRPDGVVWGAPLVLLHQFTNGVTVKKIKIASIYLIIPGVVYFISRYAYFGELLPLPFYVKSVGVREYGIFFYRSAKYTLACAAPFILAFAFRKDKQALFIISIPILFYSSMLLSQNVGNRFIAPLFFGGLVLLHNDIKDRLVVIILSIILSFKFTIVSIVSALESKNENIFALSKALNGIEGKMLITEAGRLAFYTDWYVHDSWGLNSPQFTKTLITPTDVQRLNYDLIVGNCLFVLPLPENTEITSKKNWENMCQNMIIGAQNNYETYLVPFTDNKPGFNASLVRTYRDYKGVDTTIDCRRHDLYLVNKLSNKRTQILDAIKAHDGIRYSADLDIKGNNVCR